MADRTINIQFPLGGLNRKTAYQTQSPYTSPRLSNVCIGDVEEERQRGGSRPGMGTDFAPAYEERWSEQTTLVAKPGERYGFGMVYDPDRAVSVLFGGVDAGGVDAETWEYDASAPVATRWSQKSPVHAPSARYGVAMCYDTVNDVVVLYGGIDGGGSRSSETWTYNGTDWTNTSAASPPGARYGACMCFDPDTGLCVLFGGNDGAVDDETWTFDAATTTWAQLSPGASPAARSHAAMVYDTERDVAVMFGGLGSDELADTWELAVATSTWTEISRIVHPNKRSGHAMAWDSDKKAAFLFSGLDGFRLIPDTWQWKDTEWTNISTTTSPDGCYGGGLVYDQDVDSLVAFGGLTYRTASTYSNDTFHRTIAAITLPSSPVRMISTVSHLDPNAPQVLRENWEGTALGSQWRTPAEVQATPPYAPVLSDGYACAVSYIANTYGYNASILDDDFLDGQTEWTIGVFVPYAYQPSVNRLIYLYCGMASGTTKPDYDGSIRIGIALGYAASVYDWTFTAVKRYHDANATSVQTDTAADLTTPVAGWAIIRYKGGYLDFYFAGRYRIARWAVTGYGTRFGFSLSSYGWGPPKIGPVFLEKNATAARSRSTLLMSAGGRLFRQYHLGLWDEVSTAEHQLSSDRPLQTAELNQRLYIADRGEALASGTDGATTGTTSFASATYPDWTATSVRRGDILILEYGGDETSHFVEVVRLASLQTSGTAMPSSVANLRFRIVRGVKYYDPLTNELLGLEASDGSLPTECEQAASYGGRLVLGSGHIWYMSRVDDPTDWDFTETDSGAAVPGTSSDYGTMASPIRAIIPHGSDYLLVCCDTSLWVIRGDPRYGGTQENVSRSVGCPYVLGWCFAPDGTLVFLTYNGMYGLAPGAIGTPQPVSAYAVPRELKAITASTHSVAMSFDPMRNGLYLFVANETASTVSHWWFDWDTKTFWPMDIVSSVEPFVARQVYSELHGSQVCLVGCRDAVVRRFARDWVQDGAQAFSSYAYAGPFMADAGLNTLSIAEMDATLDEDSGSVTWSLHAADTAELALDATSRCTGTWVAGLNRTNLSMLSGRAIWLKMAGAGNHWSFEGVNARLAIGGKYRMI